jgi:Xaa-Pro dipeptidase
MTTLPPAPARISRLAQELPSAGLDALILNPGPSLAYLIGVHFFLFERPIVAFFTPDKIPALVLPELEVTKAQSAALALQLFPYQDNPATWEGAFHQACRFLGWDRRRDIKAGVEIDRLRLLESRYLEAAVPGIRLVKDDLLARLRMHKDAVEIAAMRRAVSIAEAGLSAALPRIRIGMSENELSKEIGFQIQAAGSETPSNPMVASGPNGANPHATGSDRQLIAGDLLVIDFGAVYHGYCADLTRTFQVGEVAPELSRVARIVVAANAAGRTAAAPGVPAGKVDQAARAVIEQAGYGLYFTHRTGHGLGSEPHEEPYIYAENPLVLEPGMVFTVEPGIYLPGQGGVRVEDDVLITPTGAESLSTMLRDLVRVG